MADSTTDLYTRLLRELTKIDYVKPGEFPNIDLYMDQVTTFMNTHLSDSKIRKNIRSIDKGRARYYNYFSRQKWGARENYDLLINTSGKDVKQVSEAVADHLKRYLFE